MRYILSNTNDFNYETDAVPFNEMLELDRWALMHLQLLKKELLLLMNPMISMFSTMQSITSAP
ncbi:hypothetical protein EVA_16895 [gut metagenome]|uniref:Uncharacterized protein n=1 Tax=gut metagenome TaxID=749906 RepID=J9G681_9ZZZZ